MNNPFKNSMLRIVLHSLGTLLVLVVLFVLSVSYKASSVTPYLVGGLMTGEFLRIIFSKQKYLVSIATDQMAVSIQYCNRLLFHKSTSIEKVDLNVVYIHEVNRWPGREDCLSISNAKLKFSFNLVGNEVKEAVVKALDIK